MRSALIPLLFLAACGSDEPSTNLATVYDYAVTLDQPPGVNCTGTGVLDFEADTLGLTTQCVLEGDTEPQHGTAPVTNIVQDGSSLTFDVEDCGHEGTIADEEITGTLTCFAPGGGLDVSGTWTATAR